MSRLALAVAQTAQDAPRDAIAALGAIQTQAHNLRLIEKPADAPKRRRLVAIGANSHALKYSGRAELHPAVMAAVAGELMVKYGHLPEIGLISWVENATRNHRRIEIKSQLYWLAIARQAITEHIIDMCESCSGSGEVPDGPGREGAQPMKTCETCAGTGKRHYSSQARDLALAGFVHKHGRDRIQEALELIQAAELLAYRDWKRKVK